MDGIVDKSGKMSGMTLDDVMSRRSQILEFVRARKVARKASRVPLFGSVVRAESGPESDVDFLVDFEPEQHSIGQACFVTSKGCSVSTSRLSPQAG